MTELKNF